MEPTLVRVHGDAFAFRCATLCRSHPVRQACNALSIGGDFSILPGQLFSKNMIYWFTGQPGAGKSTLAAALKLALKARKQSVVHLDGEELRDITGNTDYGET